MDEQDYSKPAREHLEYPETTMSQMVESLGTRHPAEVHICSLLELMIGLQT